MIQLSHHAPRKQLTYALCRALSDRGHLEIVEDIVLVTDTSERLDNAQSLARTFDWRESQEKIVDVVRRAERESTPASRAKILAEACPSSSGIAVSMDALKAAVTARTSSQWNRALAAACPTRPESDRDRSPARE